MDSDLQYQSETEHPVDWRAVAFPVVRILLVIVVLLPPILYGVWWVAGWRVDQQRREYQNQALSISKLLSIAAQEYAVEHDNKLPDARNWEAALKPYLEKGMTAALPP